MKILEIFSLRKSFGGVRAVDDVTLSLNRGEIVGLIGPNGSGKTTLFNIISGVYKPDSGRVLFEGKRIDGLPPHEIFRRGIMRSFQIPRTFTKLTVFENALLTSNPQPGESPLKALSPSSWGSKEVENAKRAVSVLKSLSLLEVSGSWASEVSGGQMKLTELSRVFMAKPKLILLDEPAAGVAPGLAHEIFRAIVRMRDELGLTFFIIEHRLDVLFEYVERVLVMHQGRIIVEGTPDEVVSDPLVEEAYLGD